jgi:4'-phosphopantetheinyl transferase EntD
MVLGGAGTRHRCLVRSILAPAVAVREGPGGELLPPAAVATYAPYVRGAVESRVNEFVSGRMMAEAALGDTGAPTRGVGRDHRGRPEWPAGFTGSITHTQGYCAAAVGDASEVSSLGIDVELNRPLPAGLVDDVRSPGDRCPTEQLTSMGVSWSSLIFSAKESVYKALNPLDGRWLEFHDVDVRICETGVFRARPARTAGSGGTTLETLEGRWTADATHLATAVVIAAPLR